MHFPKSSRDSDGLRRDRIDQECPAVPNIELHALAASQESQNPAVQKGIVEIYQLAGVGLVLRETASIGQSDTDVVHLIDQSILETETGDGAPIPLEMIRRHCFAN